MESSIAFTTIKTVINLLDFTVQCQLFPRIKLLKFSHYIICKLWYFPIDSAGGGTSGLTKGFSQTIFSDKMFMALGIGRLVDVALANNK